MKKQYEGQILDGFIHAQATLYRHIKFEPDIYLEMDENTFIGDNCAILVPKLTMRKGSQICAGTILAGKDEVTLEENVVIGYNVVMLTAVDQPSGEFMNDASPESKRDIRRGPIILKKNSFVGSLSLIMPNVTIEEEVVVRAQSYVDKSLLAKQMVYQNSKPIYPRGK